MRTLVLLVSLFLVSPVFGGNEFICVTVVDSDFEPLWGATVSLRKVTSGTWVTGAATDEDGLAVLVGFEIGVEHTATISLFGYETQTVNIPPIPEGGSHVEIVVLEGEGFVITPDTDMGQQRLTYCPYEFPRKSVWLGKFNQEAVLPSLKKQYCVA